MKNIPIILLLITLAGCSGKYGVITHLDPQIGSQPAGIYSAGTTAAIKGRDVRKSNMVVVFALPSKQPLPYENLEPPHLVITEKLANGFTRQGLNFTTDSSVQILLQIENLLVEVSRSKFLYSAKAESKIVFNLQNQGLTLTRTYNRESSDSWATRPKIEMLEKMLNEQLSDIIMQILSDPEIQRTINTQRE